MSTNTTLQLVRFIAEAATANAFTDQVIESISTAMDLDPDEVTALIDRAIWMSKHELSQAHPPVLIDNLTGTDITDPGCGYQLITKDQVQDWVVRPVTDEEMDRLEDAIPLSSIPDAIDTIVASFDSPR